MKKSYIAVLVILGLAIISWLLYIVARGEDIELAVKDPVIGSDNAAVTIEEFADFQCPACAAAAPTIKELLATFPTQVKLVYRDFPLTQIHPQAFEVAQGGLCVAQQGKFADFSEAMYENQAEWVNDSEKLATFMRVTVLGLEVDIQQWDECMASRASAKEVRRDMGEGTSRDVQSTPTFFIDGEKIENPPSLFAWIQLIEEKLRAKGLEPEKLMPQETAEETPEGENMEDGSMEEAAQ